MLHLRRTCNVAGTYRETSLQRHFDVLLPGGLCVFLSKMSAYREDFDEAKYISFLTENDELLEKYNENLGKNSLKEKIDCESIYNEKYLKVKIKSYNRKIQHKLS